MNKIWIDDNLMTDGGMWLELDFILNEDEFHYEVKTKCGKDVTFLFDQARMMAYCYDLVESDNAGLAMDALDRADDGIYD